MPQDHGVVPDLLAKLCHSRSRRLHRHGVRRGLFAQDPCDPTGPSDHARMIAGTSVMLAGFRPMGPCPLGHALCRRGLSRRDEGYPMHKVSVLLTDGFADCKPLICWALAGLPIASGHDAFRPVVTVSLRKEALSSCRTARWKPSKAGRATCL
jgi:hypothetical protein